MILILYVTLLALSLVLVVIGLTRSHESAQALLGFFFIFLLSFYIINGKVEYSNGANTTTEYHYSPTTELNNTVEITRTNYTTYSDSYTHYIGVYLALAAAVGFAGVLFGLRRSNPNE